MQYSTIDLWKRWARGDKLPSRLSVIFGKPLEALNASEDDKGNELQPAELQQALNQFQDLLRFQKLASSRQSYIASSQSGDEFLLSISHLLRMGFHPTPGMQKTYDDLVTVSGRKPGDRALKVSLHIRHGDACNGGIETRRALVTKDTAETTPFRKCYSFSAYADALKAIHDRYMLPLDIYLATDDITNFKSELVNITRLIMEGNTPTRIVPLANKTEPVRSSFNELDKVGQVQHLLNHRNQTVLNMMMEVQSRYPEIEDAISWRYVSLKRGVFEYYKRNVIDFADDSVKPFLVNAAVQDLIHLSHGDVYVGNFGSLFTKTAYMLAVANQNSPVPYVSIDGRSVCCESDEDCAKALPLMDNMGDCLLFKHELKGGCPNSTDYWFHGCGTRDHIQW